MGESGRTAIRCECGRAFRVTPKACGKTLRCPFCQTSLRILWAIDPATRKQRVVGVPQGGPHQPKTPPPFKPHPGKLEVICSCGQTLLASPSQANREVRCPICGKSLVLEVYRDPESLETRVRRVNSSSRVPRKPPVRLSAPLPSEILLCTCGSRLNVTARHLGKQAECPTCGTQMKLDRVRDPQTSLTQVRPRILGKSPSSSTSGGESWSLDDFPAR